MFVIPDDLPIELTPFTFLLGEWRGSGIVSYPVGDKPATEIEFFQTVSFRPMANGKLDFESVVQDAQGKLLVSEKGFWMLSRPSNEGDSGPGLLPGTGVPAITVREDLELWRNAAGGFDIEALIIQPSGIAELYFGQIKGARIDIATDAVLRSPNAKEYTAAQRVLGLVEGALLWAWDMAAVGSPLKSHASARLEKIVD
ncbi:MAG: FABP family protein [Aquiluna sp.]|nr:FABP family protein [Aquiluna sp.]